MSDEFIAVGIPVVLLVFILLGAYAFANISCQKKTAAFESRDFSIFTGCMVKYNGKWLPLDNIRGFDDKG